MRPLFLSIENIKSISEKQTVDFEKLSAGGVFGIFGKTGSGKSTILDAIVLAIYGATIEKLTGGSYINTSANYARVELVFETYTDGSVKRYRVERTVKFNKARTATVSSASLWEVSEGCEISLADSTDGVNKIMRDSVIGLDKEDFLKCIALPQGEFAAFVKMTRVDRLKVIGKLFDLEKYGKELYEKAKNVDNKLDMEQAEIKGKLSEYSNKTEEEIEELRINVESVKEELDKKTEEKKLLTELNKRAKEVRTIINERYEKEEELNTKLSYKSTIDDFRKKIESYERLLPIAGEIKKLEETKAAIKRIDAEREKLSDKKRELLLKAQASAEKYALIPDYEKKCDDVSARLNKLDATKSQILQMKKKEEEIERLRLRCRNAEGKISSAEKDAAVKHSESVTLSKELSAIDSGALLNKLSAQVNANFAKERLDFLSALTKQLDKLLDRERESAVYELIDEEMAKIGETINAGDKTDLYALLSQVKMELERKNQLSGALQRRISEEKSLNESVESNKKVLEEVSLDKAAVEEELAALKVAVNSVLCGETAISLEKKLTARRDELKATVNSIKADKEHIDRLLISNESDTAANKRLKDNYDEVLVSTEKTVNDALDKLSITRDEAVSACSDENIISYRSRVKMYDVETLTLNTRLGEINAILSNVPPELYETEKIAAELTETEQNFTKLYNNYLEIKSMYQKELKNKETWCIIKGNYDKIESQRKIYGKLLELLKEMRFMEFVADEYLKEIAEEAERRVLDLTSGRYGLVYDGNFFITDNLAGGVKRPVAGLSGGETFLVSLSLALALSTQISRKALKPIDFFFLDEGFGTLDDELVDVVTDSLEKLQRDNFTVGLITHVTELKNRIQSKLYVTGADAFHGSRFTESI